MAGRKLTDTSMVQQLLHLLHIGPGHGPGLPQATLPLLGLRRQQMTRTRFSPLDFSRSRLLESLGSSPV